MTETFRSTDGSNKLSSAKPKGGVRLFGLVVAILAGGGMIFWISQVVWHRVEQLQAEFSDLRADKFYYGVELRSRVRKLNDTLLRYRLDREPRDRDQFKEESKLLGTWISNNRTNATSPQGPDFATKLETAYGEYLNKADKTMVERDETGFLGIRKNPDSMFPGSYEQVQDYSKPLLSLCDTFIANQRNDFQGFLDRSNTTLDLFQQLFRISVGLILALGLVVLLLTYRDMIAPLRRQLIQSHATIARQEKLASLGSLAAGVAHEIRNPLTAIRFRLFSLRRELPNAASDSEDVTVIASELDRLERIVNDFLKFARPSEPELVSLPVQRLVTEVMDLLEPQLAKNGIQLTLEDSDPLWVRADTQQIKQVMINLIQNAAESLEHDGAITIRVHRERNGKRDHNGRVVVEVCDSGKGVPEDMAERLFDPFFTTKEGGTGLGLPIAARIIEKHDGLIRYKPGTDGGATFSVILPRVEEHETEHFTDRG
jgi:signal transduction histidine kinase